MEIISAGSAAELKAHSDAIRSAIANHGVIVFPTDTVNGIGCSIYDDIAIKRLINLKGRDASKGLPVLVSSLDAAKQLAGFNDKAEVLAREFWPGALTLLLPLKNKAVNPRIAASGRIAVRMPGSEVARAVAEEFGGAVVGTSANESGKEPIDDFDEIAKRFPGIDIIVKSCSIRGGASSTIFDVAGGRMVREGWITLQQIRGVLDGE